MQQKFCGFPQKVLDFPLKVDYNVGKKGGTEMTFSLKQARMFADITQQEMADFLKIHRSTYIKLEEHPESTTISQAKRISEITGIPVDQIFFAS